MSSFSLDSFHSVLLVYFIKFVILSYFCDGQGSIVRDSLDIEDVDEGSIFYANSTRLAVQVSSFLNLHLSLFFYIHKYLFCGNTNDNLLVLFIRLMTRRQSG